MKQTRLINNVVGGSYEADEKIAGCSVSQNLYAESVEEASNGFYYTTALRSVEGERVVIDDIDVVDTQNQGCRGIFVASDDSIFAAFGNSIIRIRKNVVNGSYSYDEIATSDTIGNVRFCETGGINSHVCWIDGNPFVMAYPIDPVKAESQGISLPIKIRTPLRVYLTSDEIKKQENFHVIPNSICSIAGSVCVNDPENDTWYYSDAYVLGGTTYKRKIYSLDSDGNIRYKDGTYEILTLEKSLTEEDPKSDTAYFWLDRYSKPRFKTAEYSADNVVGMITGGDYLYVLGSKSLQIYTQETSTDANGFSSMVFSSSGRNIRDLGCKSPDSVAEINGNIVFLGASSRGERSVWATNGSAPVRISTNAIEREIENVDLYNSYGFGFVDNGHSFYMLTIPSIRKTYCYDFATKQWHNRSTRLSNGKDVEWWARYAVSSNGQIGIAGRGVNKFVVLDKSKFDDYRGEPIIKRRTAPILTSDFSPFIINDLQLMWNTGTTKDANNSMGAKDPVVMLEVSRDGGNTFDSEMWATGGKIGQYNHRSIWYGIGMGTMFVFRFTISDRVNVVITGAKVSHTKLAHF